MGWVSPTGFVDGSGQWSDEPYAYDDDTGTAAEGWAAKSSWSAYLELTISAIACDKVRFWARYSVSSATSIDLYVFYDEDWHHVYEGAYPDREWVEKEIPAGTKSVTKAKVRFYNSDPDNVRNPYLFEFDFNSAVAAGGAGGAAELLMAGLI